MIAEEVAHRPALRTRAWGIVGALSITETVSWGILYYAFAVFLLPMQQEPRASAAALTVPLHAVALRRAPSPPSCAPVAQRSASAREALRSAPFWLLSVAFFRATVAGIALVVQGIPFLAAYGAIASVAGAGTMGALAALLAYAAEREPRSAIA